MTYELTTQEKTDILNQHLRNLELSIYNLSLSILEEEAKSTPEAETLSSYNSDLSDLNAKKEVLLDELASL
jgi:hypothetical protein